MNKYITFILAFLFGAISMYVMLWIQAGLSFYEAMQKIVIHQ